MRPAAGRWPGRWSPPRSFSTRSNVPRGLDDSKKLTPQRREVLYERSAPRAVAVALAPPCASIATISCALRCGRWRARSRGCRSAAACLCRRPRPHRCRLRLSGGIGGDGLVASIAAASIVAKVTRDRLMTRLGAAHPGYGFDAIWATACPSISPRSTGSGRPFITAARFRRSLVRSAFSTTSPAISPLPFCRLVSRTYAQRSKRLLHVVILRRRKAGARKSLALFCGLPSVLRSVSIGVQGLRPSLATLTLAE